MGATKRGKGTKLMGAADLHGLPLAAHAESVAAHRRRWKVGRLWAWLFTFRRVAVAQGAGHTQLIDMYGQHDAAERLKYFSTDLFILYSLLQHRLDV